jgi:protein TonB
VREGRVLLRIYINERGLTDRVAVVRAEPAGIFDESAIAAFGGARYSPGTLEGMAVKSQILLEVDYRNPHEGQARFASDRASY